MRTSLLVTSLLATAAFTGTAHAQTTASKAKQTQVVSKAAEGPVSSADANKPQIGTFGFDVAGMDRSVKPGDDFTKFAGGKWEADTAIPEDRAAYGMFHVLQDLSLERTKSILETAAKTPGNKSGDFYASFMDEAAVDAKGAEPIKPWIAEIKAAGTKPAIATEMANSSASASAACWASMSGRTTRPPIITSSTSRSPASACRIAIIT